MSTLLLVMLTHLANAQSFQIADFNDPSWPDSPYVIWPGIVECYGVIANHSTSDPISSFTVHNIYSSTPPVERMRVDQWNYQFVQNPTNSFLWDYIISTTNSQAYIQPNTDFPFSLEVYYPNNATPLAGNLPNSANFLTAGQVVAKSSVFLGPAGWKNGPLIAHLEAGQTNGVKRISWTGGDGGIYLEYNNLLTQTKWITLAGPLTGGSFEFAAPINASSCFFRLRLSP